MLFSKASLAVAGVASRDASNPALNRVHLAADGSTVASDGRSLMAVEPAHPGLVARFPDVGEEHAAPPAAGVGVPVSRVAKAAKEVTSERKPSLHYVQMTRCTPVETELMATDGASKVKVSARVMRGTFPAWRGLLAEAKTGATAGRICVDRKSLIRALEAMERACPDAGNHNPAWIEFGGEEDAIFIRGRNWETRQTAVCRVSPLRTGGDWLPETDWEKGLDGANGAGAEEAPAKRRIVVGGGT